MFETPLRWAPAVDRWDAPAAATPLGSTSAEVYDRFVLRASRFLRTFTVAEALDLAREVPGYWHPTGFMVFRIPLCFGNVPVRVHCWPAGARQARVDHPPVHNHMWPLLSKVLTGSYAETVYALDESPEGDHSRYDVMYHGTNDQTVVEDPRRFDLFPIANAARGPGETHRLPAGVFHETTIPGRETVVTIMVCGEPELATCALVGRPGLRIGRQRRRPVTRAEFDSAVRDLPVSGATGRAGRNASVGRAPRPQAFGRAR